MAENLSEASSGRQIFTLLYHRIDTPDTDPWGICVSCNHFEEQIQFLKNCCNIISVADVISQLTTGNIGENCVCLTFDDGYADNYLHAKPILEKYNCPATFFISTAFIGADTPFWWDELEIILLQSKKLPACLSLEISGRNHVYIVGENELSSEQLLQHANWNWHEAAPTGRCATFLDIWKKLRPLCNEEIKVQMAGIRKWAGITDGINKQRLPMSEDQLRVLSKNPLFTIAMHTHQHPDLDAREKQLQVEEIVSCKKILSGNYGIESNCLAYPYGSYNADTIDVVKDLGIAACFTTCCAGLTSRSDMAMLGRCQIFNQDSDGLKLQLDILGRNAEYH